MAELVDPKEMPKEYGGVPVDPRLVLRPLKNTNDAYPLHDLTPTLC